MWTKILYKGINQSNFSLHQLVIKRKEKQNKRNVKHDDVKTNVIYFRTINYRIGEKKTGIKLDQLNF